MKKILFGISLALALVAVAKDQYDIRPEETADQALSAAEWQKANAAALAAATDCEALAGYVGSPAAAEALLAKVKPAYATDPMDMMRIGAVTQYVMSLKGASWWQFWAADVPEERTLWAAALLKTAEAAKDPYVCQFCLDQLRWCGFREQAPAVAALGRRSADPGVRSTADIASKELYR